MPVAGAAGAVAGAGAARDDPTAPGPTGGNTPGAVDGITPTIPGGGPDGCVIGWTGIGVGTADGGAIAGKAIAVAAIGIALIGGGAIGGGAMPGAPYAGGGGPIPGAPYAGPVPGAPYPGGAIGGGTSPGDDMPSAPPQLRQNFMPGGFSPRHAPQIVGNPGPGAGVWAKACGGDAAGARELPQLRQNDEPAGLSWPHIEQRIGPLSLNPLRVSQ